MSSKKSILGLLISVVRTDISNIDWDLVNLLGSYPTDIIEEFLLNLPQSILISLFSDVGSLKEILEEKNREKRPGRYISVQVREAVLKRDRNQCAIRGCHEKNALELHHIVPYSEGGRHTTGNLITLCANCHTKVHSGDLQVKKPKKVTMN